MMVESGRSGAAPAVVSGSDPIWYRPDRTPWMRLLNAAGGVLRKAGLKRPRLGLEAMLDLAERRAGLSDWGDPGFRVGLQVLIDAFEAQDNAHTFGRLFFREFCIRLLVNRLKIQRDLTQHPEILEVPMPRPLFIVGLPRSGTTLLHRLISEDPACRTLLFWETLEPSPPPRTETRTTDPRIARAKEAVTALNALAPRIRAAHSFEADSPEECNNLYAHGFLAGIIGFMFDVPGYVEWMRDQDLVASYRYAKQQLQLLSWRCPGDHWVLKAPAHLYALDAILEVFPDACIVQTHRDPLQVIPSLCSLSAAFRGILSDRVDLRRLGDEYVQAMTEGTDRAMAVRDSADPARFFDVPYATLVADPIGTVLAIHRHFGYAIEPDFESRMRRWLADSPQHKHGVHRYSLEEFGLDAATLNDRFAAYRDWMACRAIGTI